MHFILEIKHSDDVSDIYWGMEYVDYLDKHMAQIIREFGESKEIEEIKRQINKRHKDHLLAVVDKLRESKRRIKMKIV
jgi:guanylate kinase